ncbi:hypothetical protein PN836_005575 [Ningiella sp. W23]|uniref:hypothetical protein n=1 Tax=Ningiella sp. W23 TaxID=3023715 RepID=UPI0037569A58
MQTLEDSIAYTKRKKHFQLYGSDVDLLNKRITDLSRYLKGEETLGSVALNLDRLSTYYHWSFIELSVNTNTIEMSTLAKASYIAFETNNWYEFLGKKVAKYSSAVSFNTAVKHLGQLLYLGQYDKAKQYGNLLMKMLYGKQYDGGLVYPTHPWFMLELFCRWQGKALDKKGTRYPENLGVYQTALDNWDTGDTQLLSDIVDSLTEFHIAQSDEDVTTDEYGNEFSPEFTSSNYFIFPIEILMWLAIRKHLGLPDYIASPSNELMSMPINQLPDTPVEWVKDDLVNQCKAKLKADNPDIEFAL